MNEQLIKTPDTSKLTQKYVNKWVALSDDYKKVIVSAETLSGVLKKTINVKRKVVFRVLPNLGYVPSSS